MKDLYSDLFIKKEESKKLKGLRRGDVLMHSSGSLFLIVNEYKDLFSLQTHKTSKWKETFDLKLLVNLYDLRKDKNN